MSESQRLSFLSFTFASVLLTFSVGFAIQPAAARESSQWEWEGVPRVVAISDVHGRPDQLISLLKGTGLADDDLKWSGNKDHLVICGDMVGRGHEDRAVLDLVRRLQKEAGRAGGRVHALLGNHEIMNLVRDFRYVKERSYADFAKSERIKDRRNAWKGFKDAFSESSVEDARLEAAFNEEYPPGYFARLRAFGTRGAYGKWLLDRPAVIKINQVFFVHGGLTPEIAAYGLDELNGDVQASVRAVMRAGEVLQDVVKVPPGFQQLTAAAKQLTEMAVSGQRVPAKYLSAAETMLEQLETFTFSPRGPIWYRGNALENERVEREPVTRVLELLGGKALVVGHTVTRTGRINSRFNERLYRVDVGMGRGRDGLALLLEGDQVSVLDPKTGTISSPVAEPPYGEGWALGYENLPDMQLEQLLQEAEVTERTEVVREGQQAEIWELRVEGIRLRGVFKDIEEPQVEEGRAVASRRYQNELAAYWLDRQLELRLVPVVVLRTEDGKMGALRAAVETAIDMVSVKSYGQMEEALTDEVVQAIAEDYDLEVNELEEQITEAAIFDALIGNPHRKDNDKLFFPSENRVMLVDHEGAFALTEEVQPFLPKPCGPITSHLEHALKALDLDELKTHLGGYLSEDQIEALLSRRDGILERCVAAQ